MTDFVSPFRWLNLPYGANNIHQWQIYWNSGAIHHTILLFNCSNIISWILRYYFTFQLIIYNIISWILRYFESAFLCIQLIFFYNIFITCLQVIADVETFKDGSRVCKRAVDSYFIFVSLDTDGKAQKVPPLKVGND